VARDLRHARGQARDLHLAAAHVGRVPRKRGDLAVRVGLGWG
jgi:hypothetical protein